VAKYYVMCVAHIMNARW